MKIKKGGLTLVKTENALIPNLINTIASLTIRNHRQFTDIIRMALKALEEKDPYTEGHSIRVTKYALKIGRALCFNKKELKDLELTGLLHDIGKLAIPDSILNKEGRLTKAEFKIMQSHASKGEEIVSQIESFAHVRKYIRHHHERYDGYGYPDGIKGDKIPLISRIMFLADTFDAMTSKRPYREAFPIDVVAKEIEYSKGTQFDPELADIFLEIIRTEKEKIAV